MNNCPRGILVLDVIPIRFKTTEPYALLKRSPQQQQQEEQEQEVQEQDE